MAIEPEVTLQQWIKRLPIGRQAPLREEYKGQNSTGELLYVRMSVDGHKHGSVEIVHHLYDAATDTRVRAFPAEIEAPSVPLKSPSEQSVQLLWIQPLQEQDGKFYVRVELRENGEVLAVADSPPIVNGRFSASARARG